MKDESTILDTKPLIKLFAKGDGWEAVQRILSKAEAGEIEASISVVTLTEIYFRYVQEKMPELAKARIEQLRYATYPEKLEIGKDVALMAGKFKGKYNVPVADAFIAATAYFEGSIVISGDMGFKRIFGVKAFTEMEFITHILGANK